MNEKRFEDIEDSVKEVSDVLHSIVTRVDSIEQQLAEIQNQVSPSIDEIAAQHTTRTKLG